MPRLPGREAASKLLIYAFLAVILVFNIISLAIVTATTPEQTPLITAITATNMIIVAITVAAVKG